MLPTFSIIPISLRLYLRAQVLKLNTCVSTMGSAHSSRSSHSIPRCKFQLPENPDLEDPTVRAKFTESLVHVQRTKVGDQEAMRLACFKRDCWWWLDALFNFFFQPRRLLTPCVLTVPEIANRKPKAWAHNDSRKLPELTAEAADRVEAFLDAAVKEWRPR